MPSEYLSVSQYAALNDKDPGNIRRLLASGRLEGQKIGNQWIIPKDAAYPQDNRETTGEYRNWRKRTALNENKSLMKSVRKMVLSLRSIYGDAVSEIILYGSYARGTQDDESDVDIAVFLSEKPSKQVTDAMIECAAYYGLECGKVLSVVDISLEMYNNWKDILPFYKNIRKDGIVLWKAAA